MRIVHLLRGTAIAAGVAALALALALLAFGRLYYLHALLAAGAVLLFLAGWFVYLKEDGFIRGQAAPPAGDPAGGPRAGRRGAAGAEPRAGTSGSAEPLLGLFAPRDGLVARSPADHERPVRSRASAAGDARRELLVAAAELALLSAALYALAGIGASYFV